MTLQFLLQRAWEDAHFDNFAVHEPEDDRDALLTLLAIYGAPDHGAGQPAVTALKARLELWLIGCVDARMGTDTTGSVDAGHAIAVIARRCHDPIYEWLAMSADWQQLRTFLALESEVQPRDDMPTSGLFRLALGGLLSTNAELLPELVGAQSLAYGQAPRRTAQITSALRRLGAPAAVVDALTRHAEPPVRREVDPEWAPRMIRGARWQADVDGRFFRECHTLLATHELQTA